MDHYANFAYSTVQVPPAPPLTGTKLTVRAGDGAIFPVAPFPAIVAPQNALPLGNTAEILYVTAKEGDQLTFERHTQGSTARAIVAGDQIYVGFTEKTWTDLLGLIEEGGHLPTVHQFAANAELAWGTDNYVDASAGNITMTLPTAVGNGGRDLFVRVISGGLSTVTIKPHAGETINGAASLVLSSPEGEAALAGATIKSDNANCQIA